MPEAFDISAFGHFVFDKTVVTAQDNEKEPIESKFVLLDFHSFLLHSRVARWFVFKPKHPNLGKFWRALELKMLIH
jgi:hypothetical protein